MKELYIIKIGGNCIDDETILQAFIKDLSILSESFILVHGGGKLATTMCEKIGVETTLVDGRRITDAETLEVVVMVYAGLINKQLVAKLQAQGCNAIGLCGADANIITAQQRTGTIIDYGFVGDIDTKNISVDMLSQFIDSGFCPVISPITHDGAGQLLNTNADTIASSLAIAFSSIYKTHLIYCFEKKGVLENIEQDDSVIPLINYAKYTQMKKDGIISKGMIPKLDNAFEAIKHGVSEVLISHVSQIKNQLQLNTHAGTKLIN